jgi:hypothetical protein
MKRNFAIGILLAALTIGGSVQLTAQDNGAAAWPGLAP